MVACTVIIVPWTQVDSLVDRYDVNYLLPYRLERSMENEKKQTKS